MKKGDIVLIPFPFTDLTGSKSRPALVLAGGELEIADVQLTGSEESGLKKKSLIRLSKLATIDRELALGKLGELNEEQILLVNTNLKQIFQL